MAVTASTKRSVFDRAEGLCEYCKTPAGYATQRFSIEHIIPQIKSGTDEANNLALACQGCNGHKFTKTTGIDPISLQTVRLFHPRDDHWSEHFEWDEWYTQIIGLTPTGRATIEALRLNRPELLNLRTALLAIAVHPPR